MFATFFTFLAGFVLGAGAVVVLNAMDAEDAEDERNERRRAAVRKAGE
jgi:predicted outer membrane lipoprotein